MAPLLLRTALLLAAVGALAHPFPFPDPAKLRRIPRIYNALITTDEQLLPSQAYPAVAPVLRPAPLAHYNPYPYALPPVQDPYGVYAPDPYGLQSYSRIPGFNDTLRNPNPETPSQRQTPLYSLQARQTVPQVNDQIKNNRPNTPGIPDVPPPPLPLSPPRGRDDQGPERKPEDYPPAPPQGLPF